MKLGFYTVPTGNRTPGRRVADHHATAAPRQLQYDQAKPMSLCWLLSTQIHRISKWVIMCLADNLQGTGWIEDWLIWGRVGPYLEAGWTGNSLFAKGLTRTHSIGTTALRGRILGSGSSPVSWCNYHEGDKSVWSYTSWKRVQDAKKDLSSSW